MKRIILSVSLSLWLLIPCNAAHDIEALRADMRFFTDASCRQLRPRVQSKDLDGFRSDVLKTVAAGMLSGTYDTTYRAADYEAYPSPRELGRTLKLGDGFSRYENITGICLERGEHVIFVGNTGGKKLRRCKRHRREEGRKCIRQLLRRPRR